MSMNKALQQYSSVRKISGVEAANPHRLIQMLYEGLLERLNMARGCMERKEYAAKGMHIDRALAIIQGLQGFLDMEKGGDLAQNLNQLYDYTMIIIYEASRDLDTSKVDEAISLIRTIKEGWDGIAQEAEKMFSGDGAADGVRSPA